MTFVINGTLDVITQTAGVDDHKTLLAFMEAWNVGYTSHLESSVEADPDLYIINFTNNLKFIQNAGTTLNLGTNSDEKDIVEVIFSGGHNPADFDIGGQLNIGYSELNKNVRFMILDSAGKTGAFPSIFYARSGISGTWFGARLSSAGAVNWNNAGGNITTNGCLFERLGDTLISINVALTLNSTRDTFSASTFFRVRPTLLSSPIVQRQIVFNSQVRSGFIDSPELIITNPNILAGQRIGFFGMVSSVLLNIDSFKTIGFQQSGNYQIDVNCCRAVNQILPKLTLNGVGKNIKMYIEGKLDGNESGDGKYYQWSGGQLFVSFPVLFAYNSQDIRDYLDGTNGKTKRLNEYLTGYEKADTHFLTADSNGDIPLTNVNLYLLWENNPRNMNFNSNISSVISIVLNYRTFGGATNPSLIQYWLGHTDIQTKYITRDIYTAGEPLTFTEDTIPDTELTNNEVDVLNYTQIETSAKLYNYLKYIKWISEVNLKAGGLLPQENICYREGTKLKIRNGWTLELHETQDWTGGIVDYTDIGTQVLRVVVGKIFTADKDIDFSKVIKVGDVTLKGKITYINASDQVVSLINTLITASTTNLDIPYRIDYQGKKSDNTTEYIFRIQSSGNDNLYNEVIRSKYVSIERRLYGARVQESDLEEPAATFRELDEIIIEKQLGFDTEWLAEFNDGTRAATITTTEIILASTSATGFETIESEQLNYIIHKAVENYNVNHTPHLVDNDFSQVVGQELQIKKVIKNNSVFGLRFIDNDSVSIVTLNDGNENLLGTHNFGNITIRTSTRTTGALNNLISGDIIYNQVGSGVITKATATGSTYNFIFNRSDELKVRIGRNGSDSILATISESNSTLTPNFISINSFPFTTIDTREPNDYFEFLNNEILVKQATSTATSNLEISEQEEINLLWKWWVNNINIFGIDGNIIFIDKVNGIANMNYIGRKKPAFQQCGERRMVYKVSATNLTQERTGTNSHNETIYLAETRTQLELVNVSPRDIINKEILFKNTDGTTSATAIATSNVILENPRFRYHPVPIVVLHNLGTVIEIETNQFYPFNSLKVYLPGNTVYVSRTNNANKELYVLLEVNITGTNGQLANIKVANAGSTTPISSPFGVNNEIDFYLVHDIHFQIDREVTDLIKDKDIFITEQVEDNTPLRIANQFRNNGVLWDERLLPLSRNTNIVQGGFNVDNANVVMNNLLQEIYDKFKGSGGGGSGGLTEEQTKAVLLQFFTDLTNQQRTLILKSKITIYTIGSDYINGNVVVILTGADKGMYTCLQDITNSQSVNTDGANVWFKQTSDVDLSGVITKLDSNSDKLDTNYGKLEDNSSKIDSANTNILIIKDKTELIDTKTTNIQAETGLIPGVKTETDKIPSIKAKTDLIGDETTLHQGLDSYQNKDDYKYNLTPEIFANLMDNLTQSIYDKFKGAGGGGGGATAEEIAIKVWQSVDRTLTGTTNANILSVNGYGVSIGDFKLNAAEFNSLMNNLTTNVYNKFKAEIIPVNIPDIANAVDNILALKFTQILNDLTLIQTDLTGMKTTLIFLEKYNKNKVRWFSDSAGTLPVTSDSALFVWTFDDDGVTPLIKIKFLDVNGNNVTSLNATTYETY